MPSELTLLRLVREFGWLIYRLRSSLWSVTLKCCRQIYNSNARGFVAAMSGLPIVPSQAVSERSLSGGQDIEAGSAIDGVGNRTEFGCDDAGRRTSVTDPANKVSTMTYDSMGRVTQTKDPLNSTVAIQYDYCGRQTIVIDQMFNGGDRLRSCR